MVAMDILNERQAYSTQHVHRHGGHINSVYSAMNGKASKITEIEEILEGIEN